MTWSSHICLKVEKVVPLFIKCLFNSNFEFARDESKISELEYKLMMASLFSINTTYIYLEIIQLNTNSNEQEVQYPTSCAICYMRDITSHRDILQAFPEHALLRDGIFQMNVGRCFFFALCRSPKKISIMEAEYGGSVCFFSIRH